MTLENPKSLSVEQEFRINGYDIDVMGIVSNIVYIRWFEDLRVLFLDRYLPFEQLLETNCSPILAKTEIEYKFPLTYFDHPVGRARISRMTRALWEMHFEIESRGRIVCSGFQKGYFIDLARKKPVPIPEELVRLYAETKTEG